MKLTERYRDALNYSFALHSNQVRKASGTPYMAHLLAVSALTLEAGGSEDVAIAALLHDAIEDQGGSGTQREIRKRFGPTVESLVVGCSDHLGGRKKPWWERKEQFIQRLTEAPADVMRIVAADKLHNARSLLTDYDVHGPFLWEYFNGQRQGTVWNFRNITRVLVQRLPDDMNVQRLKNVLVEIEKLD